MCGRIRIEAARISRSRTPPVLFAGRADASGSPRAADVWAAPDAASIRRHSTRRRLRSRQGVSHASWVHLPRLQCGQDALLPAVRYGLPKERWTMTEEPTTTADATYGDAPTTAKVPVVVGGPVQALIPQNIEEAFRVAHAFDLAQIAPKGLDTREKILAVIMGGAELGFAPMQALASFAWINGRICIYGDAVPALLWTNGIKVREWIENEAPTYPDNMTAHCEITRPDGTVIERKFSVLQAKTAKLWGKRGRDGQDTPWITYPDRMLQMRARSWAARDGAADVLKGRPILEEVQDYTVERVTGPQKSGLIDRLKDRGFKEGNVDAALNETVEEATVEEVSPVADKVAEVVTAMRHAETRADLEVAKLDGEHIEGATQGDRDWMRETYEARREYLAGVHLSGDDEAQASIAVEEGEVTSVNIAAAGGMSDGSPPYAPADSITISNARVENPEPETAQGGPPTGYVEDHPGFQSDTPPQSDGDDEAMAEELADPDAAPPLTPDELRDWAASYLRGLPHLTTVDEVADSWESPAVKSQAVALKAVAPALAATLVKAVNDRVKELKRK